MGISQLRADLWVFPPNRHSAGGNAWLLRSSGGCSVLVDAPLLNEENQLFLESQPPGWIVLSHRQGHGQCKRWQQLLGWPVLLHEQEAYLLPNLELTNQAALHSFSRQHSIEPGLNLLWTPGPSPGSCVLHWSQGLNDVLFCGRLLWPTAAGGVCARPSDNNFHWPRLQRSLEQLQAWLPSGSPGQIACAAGLGPLAGAKLVEHGARALQLRSIANAEN